MNSAISPVSDVSTPDPLEAVMRDLEGEPGRRLLDRLEALQPGQTINLGPITFTGLEERRFSLSWCGEVHSTWGFPQ